MNWLRKVFGRERVVLPVIHVESHDQAMANVHMARDAGADGVFLINHSISDEKLLRIHAEVISDFPNWWVGVNCLGLAPADVLRAVSGRVSGVWVDNAMIREEAEAQLEADRVLRVRKERKWPGLYFGGVAFKYQEPVRDLANAVQIASRYMDVVTTSGPGTGQAAAPAKIRTMKEALGEFPLAIASGITPENVDDYLPWADCFLVATGISKSFVELDRARVKALVERVHSFKAKSVTSASELMRRRLRAGSLKLTQEFVFETDQAKQLEAALLAICPVIFARFGLQSRTVKVVKKDPWEGRGIFHPSFAARGWMSANNPDKVALYKARSLILHLPVCAITATNGIPGTGAAMHINWPEVVGEAIQLAEAADEYHIPRAEFLGCFDAEGPFEGCDGSVKIGYRADYSEAARSEEIWVSRCHIYYSK